jgi:hypothetical protein
MRPLQALISRRQPADKPAAVRKPSAADIAAEAAGAAKPRRKRCINEGGHKLYR